MQTIRWQLLLIHLLAPVLLAVSVIVAVVGSFFVQILLGGLLPRRTLLDILVPIGQIAVPALLGWLIVTAASRWLYAAESHEIRRSSTALEPNRTGWTWAALGTHLRHTVLLYPAVVGPLSAVHACATPGPTCHGDVMLFMLAFAFAAVGGIAADVVVQQQARSRPAPAV